MRRMYDASVPPVNPPDWEIVAGYIGGDTPRIWTNAQWDSQPVPFRLPIFTRNIGGDPFLDAEYVNRWMSQHKVPLDCFVALDFETRVDRSYLLNFDGAVKWPVMVYGSKSTVTKNPEPSGGYWVADWPPPGVQPTPHLVSWSMATQYSNSRPFGGAYDASLVSDDATLWQVKGVDPAMTTDEVNAIAAATAKKWQDTYGIRLAQWIAGMANSVYSSTTVGAPAPDRLTALADSLAQAVVDRLTMIGGVAWTTDQVKEAVKDAFREGTGANA